ncbi:MAG: PorT family protein [Bacteroidaceae bacterium]|nr:PorT family protein [Bacteroidaceae bacterium]
MKRYLTILLLTLSTVLPAGAQLRLGLDVGVDLSHVSFDKAIADSKEQQGFFFGPKLKATIPMLGLGADVALRYAQRNVCIIDDMTSVERQTYLNDHMSYVEVPVNIRWDFGLPALGIYIATGPQWDWYIGEGSWTSVGQFQANFEHSVYSWNIGAGLWLFNHLDIGIAVNIPLTKQGSYISDAYNALRKATEEIQMKNHAFQLSLDFYF